MPNFININNCNGCSACANVCPVNAISMVPDVEGFLTPKLSYRECISCGKCDAICTAQNKKMVHAESLAYMAIAKENYLEKSSSGGVFGVIADYILSIGGEVCGAVFDDNFHVKHILSKELKDIARMKKSKYVQSEIGNVYKDIKNRLERNIPVLFSGTPCQVNGLCNFLKKDYDCLYTFDILCFGVPSPAVWETYLKEEQLDKNLVAVDFRPKFDSNNWGQKIEFEYPDTNIVYPRNINTYFSSFTTRQTLRKSCYNCKWTEGTRVGDISGGDFWGAKSYPEYKEYLTNNKGISLLYISSEKGKKLIESVMNRFSVLKPIPIKHALTSQRPVFNKPHLGRKYLFDNIGKKPLKEIVSKNNSYQFDVAIYGNTLSSNYGAALTYLALYTEMATLGYKPILIAPPVSEKGEPLLPRKAETVKFFKKHSVVTNSLPFSLFPSAYKNIAPAFILGSDQVWKYRLFRQFGMSFYLDFVDSNKRKIAYAASFGDDKIMIDKSEKPLIPIMQDLISSFDNISVREESGINICRDVFRKDATNVLDPVFFLTPNYYKTLTESPNCLPKNPFVLSYMIGTHEDNISVNKAIAENKGYDTILIGDGEYDKQRNDDRFLHNVSIGEWLWYFQNCEYVVTSSFHGMCFAIIFRKPFFLVDAKSAATRFDSLIKKLGLEHIRYDSYEEFKNDENALNNKIDYNEVYNKLYLEIYKSEQWLKDALIGI